MGLIKTIISLGMILLFSIAILTYVGDFGTDNDARIKLSQDSNLTNINNRLITEGGDYRDTTASVQASFSESTIEAGDETSRTGGVFKQLSTVYDSFKIILNGGQKTIFGNDSSFGLVFTLLSSFMLIIIILYSWKAWAGKNPD